jgi:hypothetical protein
VRFHPPAALHLAEAQRAIVADWRTSYREWIDPKGCGEQPNSGE